MDEGNVGLVVSAVTVTAGYLFTWYSDRLTRQHTAAVDRLKMQVITFGRIIAELNMQIRANHDVTDFISQGGQEFLDVIRELAPEWLEEHKPLLVPGEDVTWVVEGLNMRKLMSILGTCPVATTEQFSHKINASPHISRWKSFVRSVRIPSLHRITSEVLNSLHLFDEEPEYVEQVEAEDQWWGTDDDESRRCWVPDHNDSGHLHLVNRDVSDYLAYAADWEQIVTMWDVNNHSALLPNRPFPPAVVPYFEQLYVNARHEYAAKTYSMDVGQGYVQRLRAFVAGRNVTCTHRLGRQSQRHPHSNTPSSAQPSDQTPHLLSQSLPSDSNPAESAPRPAGRSRAFSVHAPE